MALLAGAEQILRLNGYEVEAGAVARIVDDVGRLRAECEQLRQALRQTYTLGMRRGLLVAELTDDEIMKTETLVAVLRDLDARLRECMALGLSAAEAYDSFYQETTAEALAVGAAYAELTGALASELNGG